MINTDTYTIGDTVAYTSHQDGHPRIYTIIGFHGVNSPDGILARLVDQNNQEAGYRPLSVLYHTEQMMVDYIPLTCEACDQTIPVGAQVTIVDGQIGFCSACLR